jgi:hypothetical protein
MAGASRERAEGYREQVVIPQLERSYEKTLARAGVAPAPDRRADEC